MPLVPLCLAAFVAGDLLVQQLAALPSAGAFLAVAAIAAIPGAAGVRACAQPGAPQRVAAAALAGTAFLLLGVAATGLRAGARLADELAFADEGRDVRVVAVVASLPSVFDGGTRFTADIERVLPATGATFAVPHRVALAWYAGATRQRADDARQTPAGQSPPRPAPPAVATLPAPNAAAATPAPPTQDPSAATPLILPAQRWEWTVRLHRPQASVNPAGFDAEAWMLEQGVRAQGTVRAGAHDLPPRLLDERVLQFNPLVDRARARLRQRLQQLLQGRRYASVIVALVMGDQGGISEDDWSLFNRTGISHLVSISGLHITMIAALAALAVGALWRRSPYLLRVATVPVVRSVAAIVGGLAYCLLAGWGVPAQRTLLMLSVVALARCGRAQLGAAAILAWAAALVCVWDPWAVLAAGFWLSFGAVACIFLVSSGSVAPLSGWRSAAREAVRIQAAITVGQIPLTLAIFGQVSLVAPLANAVAIPVVSYLVAPLALLGAALAACGDFTARCAGLLLAGADALFGALAVLLQWLTTPQWSWVALPLPPAAVLGLAAVSCAWLLAPRGWPLRWLGICGTLPLFVWPVQRPGSGELWVTALDVGQGMALVLETSHHLVLFDTGPRYAADADAASRVIVPYLRARGLARVDVLIISHPDIDHAGGAQSILHLLAVDRVWTSIAPGHRLLGVTPPLTRCEAGQRLVLGELTLEMLHPDVPLYDQARASTNARSCVVLAEVNAHRVLLTGDIPERQEQQMLARAQAAGRDLRVDLLVAPHHGSHSSSSEALVTASAAQWVSMQLGYRNHYGHPHADVVARYRAHHIAVERSDERGAVQWRFTAAGVAVECWRLDHARYWFNQPTDAAPR